MEISIFISQSNAINEHTIWLKRMRDRAKVGWLIISVRIKFNLVPFHIFRLSFRSLYRETHCCQCFGFFWSFYCLQIRNVNHVRNIDRISYLEYVSWLLQLYSNRFDLHSSLLTDQSYSLSHSLRVSVSVCLKLALVLMQNNPRYCAHIRKFHVFAIPFYIYRHVCALCCCFDWTMHKNSSKWQLLQMSGNQNRQLNVRFAL